MNPQSNNRNIASRVGETSALLDRPEHGLLLCCVRTKPTPPVIDRLRHYAASNIDYDYLFELARRHSVVPLLYRQLQNHASDLANPVTLQRLKVQFQENSARNAVLSAELCRLVNLFAESNIEAIPYKGPLLGLVAYGDVSLRRFVDLDILVRKKGVLRARDLLLQEGYEPTKSLSLAQQEVLLRTQHNLQFARDQRQLIVELHWEVATRLFASSVQTDDLWNNLDSVDLSGTQLKTLKVDDLLFSLCVHGSRHLWERLSWIVDIAELISRHELNWSALLARAASTDNERMFLLGLSLAADLLDAPLPPEVKERCDADDRLPSLAQNIVAHLFSGTRHVPASSREIFEYNIGVRKSWSARARYFVYMLRPTDSDLQDHAVPSGLGFVYYLTRPFRLLLQNRER
jgi:hypothetical protein